MDKRELIRIAKYLFVGGSSALMELLLFQVLLSVICLPVVPSNLTAIAVSTVYNFLLNRAWSFQQKGWTWRSVVLYILLFCFNSVFSSAFIFVLSSMDVVPVVAKLISMACIVCWNYILYKRVIFK